MLRQCIGPDQRDWVAKLPAIEFAINSARSESTGYAPFFLNAGRMPKAMIWSSTTAEYPSVREFALQKKLALISAHDSILVARVKQTRDANRKRQSVPFQTNDLVYLSTKNISFPKGLARKLVPKFIGPYKILKDYGNGSFQLDLPPHLKKRGVHNVFHSSLLRIHVPNDDRLFPGRMDTQVLTTDDAGEEWTVDKILSHHGSRMNAVFEILWKSGDVTWLPYYQITHLQALAEYLDLIGVSKIHRLPNGSGHPPQDDPQLYLGSIISSSQSPSITEFLSSISQGFLSIINTAFSSIVSLFPRFPYPSFVSATVDLGLGTAMSPLPCVNHPLFTRLSPTHYLIKSPGAYLNGSVHVGQLADTLGSTIGSEQAETSPNSTPCPLAFRTLRPFGMEV
jgi:hypothetical protein